MQPRPWHRSYPEGMPLDAPIEPGLTLPGLLLRSFDRYPEHIAFTCAGADLSYSALERLSSAFAAYWQHCGMQQGDRVALMLPNSLVYAVALTGALRAGLVVVSVNPLYTARELAYQLKDSGATAIVASHAALPLIDQVSVESDLLHVVYATAEELLPTGTEWPLNRGRGMHDGVTPFGHAIALGEAGTFATPKIDANDIAFLQYTGGTTGVAKGAALSQANMVASAVQMLTWLDKVFEPGNCSCVTPLPLYHIYPLNVALLLFSRGGTNRLLANPRDIGALLTEFKRAPFSILIGVNTLFNGLLASGGLTREDFAGTGTVIGAGATIQQSVAQRWNEATGVPIREGYGLTECSPCVAFNVLGGAEWTGSIGVPMPSTDVQVIGGEGRAVQPGERGELCVKGPQVFSGYWGRPGESAKAFTEDGWFRTGDVVTMDGNGFLYVVDRLKDMILVSGFNVYPNEIEAVVAMMPSVLECACIGEPDDRSGEVPHLFVVPRDESVTAAQVEAHCRTNLTAYKVPRHISFVDALPKSPVGKILRKELRTGRPSRLPV